MTRLNERPLISVIMPAYNASAFINDSIESFIQQDYPSKELIIIDDGSTDNLFKKVEQLLQRHPNINFFRQENSGVSAARNNGIHKAKGDWVAFLDADDIWYKTKLSNQWESMENEVWSHTDSHYFGIGYEHRPKRSDLSQMAEGEVFWPLLKENFITTSSVLVKKDILFNAGGFDEKLKALEDWSLWLAIAEKYPLCYVPKPLLSYRVHKSSTSRKAREMLPLHLFVIDKAFETINTTNKEKLRSLSYSKAYTIISYISEDSGDKTFSLKCALRSFIHDRNTKTLKRLLACLINRFLRK